MNDINIEEFERGQQENADETMRKQTCLALWVTIPAVIVGCAWLVYAAWVSTGGTIIW